MPRLSGLSAGASAPEVLVTEVVAYLKRLGSFEEVEELTVIEEDVEFLLPKELVTVNRASISALSPSCLPGKSFQFYMLGRQSGGPSTAYGIFSLLYRKTCATKAKI